jgi:signal transduction histidine kinase
MRPNLGHTKSLLIPLFSLVGILLVALAMLLFRAVQEQNHHALENSVHVAEAVFRNLGSTLEVTVRDYSWWQEAIDKIIVGYDLEWAENNIGAFVHENSDVAVTLVFDRDDAVRYAAVDTEVVDGSVLDKFGPGLHRLAERVRSSPYDGPEPASAFVAFGDEIHLAAAGAMTPEDLKTLGSLSDPRPVLIFTRRIDDRQLADMAGNYLLPGLELVRPGDGRPILHPLSDAEGNVIAGLAWEVPEPGTQLLRDLALPAALISAVALGLMIVVCRGIFASAQMLRDQNRLLAEGEAIAIRALGEVAAANQQKSWFLAQMSHELRTPLNAVIGFSDAMATGVFGSLQPRYQEYAGHILSSARHLLSLVNDLLDLSKIEAGALTLAREEVDVVAAARSGLAVIGHEAKRSGIVLKADLPPDLPKIVADERAVRQIFINLLANAVKFTPEGGVIAVSARVQAKESVTVEIADSGVGMTPNELETALKPFGRAATPFVQSRQGTGLGLPISRHLAEAQGARFDISSRPGAGTVIRITFKVDRAEPGEAPMLERMEPSDMGPVPAPHSAGGAAGRSVRTL